MAGLGDLFGMMRNLGSLQQKVQAVQEELSRERAQGEAGGGLVRATVNGRLELLDLKIDPAIVDRDDVPLLEDLVRAAVSQALEKGRELQRDGMTRMLGDLPLPPGLNGLIGGF